MTFRGVVRRLLGLEASPTRIARRVQRLEESATTAATAEYVRSALAGACAAGHALARHEYFIVTSIPLSSDADASAPLSELAREDWTALQTRFGFGNGKTLDVILVRCPQGSIHAFAVVNAHDLYERDHVVVRRVVDSPENANRVVTEWDSFDTPRRITPPVPSRTR